MRHRANYVIIEDEKSEIYFSSSGALTVPSVLLGGLDATTTFIRSLKPDTYLQTTTWAEGGIGLDLDHRRLIFFGGFSIDQNPAVCRLLLQTLRALWQDWTVEWAAQGAGDLALLLGWNVEQTYDLFDYGPSALWYSDGPLIETGDIVTTRDSKNARTLLSIRSNDRQIYDYSLATEMLEALSLGPSLLDALEQLPTTPLPIESDPYLPRFSAYLDSVSKQLYIVTFGEIEPHDTIAITKHWPGWRVEIIVDGLIRLVTLSGRDPTSVKAPREQIIQEFLDEIVQELNVNPQTLLEAIHQQLSTADVQVGADSFSTNTSQISNEEKLDLVLRFIQQLELREN